MFAAVGTAHVVPANAVNAPEFDPAALSSGIAILGGSLLLVAERRRKSK
jgi:hypothetical protein